MPSAEPSPVKPVRGLRRDLRVAIQERAGRRVAVVKDPVAHRFHELDAEDYEIVRRLDLSRPLPGQLAALRACAPGLASLSEAEFARRVTRLLAELRASGLADGSSEAAPAGTPRLWRQALRGVSSILFIRVRLGDPSRLLDATRHWFGFAFARWFWICGVALLVVSALRFASAGGFSALDARSFGSTWSLVALYAGVAALKFIHEAAHAIVVRRHGGAVHEVGVMLMAGLPLFYVEASDSYLFPQKSHRMAVAAAGILAELLVAAALVWPWFVLADGFLRQWVLHLILVASIGTVLFNGNPLMRFDGYYVLADWLDMPSLRERARRYLALRVERFLLGEAGPELKTFSAREGRILAGYGVASQVYLVLVVLGMWLFLAKTLAPFGLKWIGDLLVGAWAASALAWPLAGFARGLWRRARAATPRRRRVLAIGGGLALLGLLVLCTPAPRWVDRACELRPKAETLVRAAEDGLITEVRRGEGDPVRAGEVLATLENRALNEQTAALTARLAHAEAALRAANAGGPAESVGAARDERAAARLQLDDALRRLDGLVLRAEVDGTVASRDLDHREGARLLSGEVFCVVRPRRLDEFVIPLTEKEARLVRTGAQVRLRLRAYPERSFDGVVAAPPLRQRTTRDAAQGPDAGTETHFATVRISQADAALRIGLTGRVRIACGSTPVGLLLLEHAWEFLRLDLRLR